MRGRLRSAKRVKCTSDTHVAMPAQHHTVWARASSVSAKLEVRDLFAGVLSWSVFPASHIGREINVTLEMFTIKRIQKWRSGGKSQLSGEHQWGKLNSEKPSENVRMTHVREDQYPSPYQVVQIPKTTVWHHNRQWVTAHHLTLRSLLYLINSLTLESALWTLGPPCDEVSRSWTIRCLSGVKVKERYAPERSTLLRMAFLRTRDGEEVAKASSWLLCGSSEDFWFFFYK